MLNLSKGDLLKWYGSGKSMAEIATILGCSVHKIVYWMDKHGLRRRTRSEATYIKLNPEGDPFDIKRCLTRDDSFLLGLGIGLYWGEGEKVSPHALRVGNTDPGVIKTFIKFLLGICGARKDKLYYNIVCFNDTDPELARGYWAKQLKTSPEKFGKITQIPSQGKGNYKRKSRYGVCTVAFGNIKLKRWMMEQIEKLKSPVSSMAERSLGKT